jgi:RNA polymerase sigma-70 factor (ECF subfamily)
VEVFLREQVAAARTREESDEALVAKARGGDRNAFDVLARRHVARLVGAARRLLRDASEAEDAAADALVKAHAALPRLARDAAFGPWIHRVVLRAALDRLRARRNAPARLDDAPEGADARARNPAEIAASRDELDHVRAAVDALPEAQRVVLVLHAWEGLSYRDIAAIVGCSYDAVRVNAAHARRTLHVRLGTSDANTDEGELS